jgi:hypothetical protein
MAQPIIAQREQEMAVMHRAPGETWSRHGPVEILLSELVQSRLKPARTETSPARAKGPRFTNG